ncbi:MAG: SGNH/GDSL hydrolase family protein [Actinomycetes bacterium]|nr:SGNH/GDSL hydrolase family protein [Actinomycetes bacterium]MDX5381210.1 SGNH/GDSL hydrolase family protein [Actinomycetes bacterium]MDX5400517.1 SGNH/GDSL hydrolase family protein [Actinomycetes bacterium]MDX5450975.1 SGNH/GDSL hydrolase family protein [Actinomycetes bacterium]
MNARRWALVAAAVVTVAIAVVAVLQFTSGPASAAYVALGDSYASGAGTSSGTAEENECRRSDAAHPNLLAAEVEALADLDFVACSGATTEDLLAEQLPAVGAGTQVVTMTIGGNDVGLTRSLRVCALTPESTDCTGAVAGAQDVIGQLPARIADVIGQVRERAPEARVFVTAYPVLVGADVVAGTAACTIAGFDVPPEVAQVSDAINNSLNEAVAAGVEQAGDPDAVFVDVAPAFEGHDLCAADPWINGVVLSGGSASVNSFHLNAAGERAYADALLAAGIGG